MPASHSRVSTKRREKQEISRSSTHIDRSSHFRCCALDASRPAAAAAVVYTHTRASQINTHQRHRQIRERIKVSAVPFSIIIIYYFPKYRTLYMSSVINQLNYDERWNHVIIISGEIGYAVARSLSKFMSRHFVRRIFRSPIFDDSRYILLFLLSIYYYHHYQKDNRIKIGGDCVTNYSSSSSSSSPFGCR